MAVGVESRGLADRNIQQNRTKRYVLVSKVPPDTLRTPRRTIRTGVSFSVFEITSGIPGLNLHLKDITAQRPNRRP